MPRKALSKPFVRIACAAAIASGAADLDADTVVTQDGARLTGEITKIADGTIRMTTDYAGELKIDQAKVASFSTDDPVSVRLVSGTTMAGPVQSGDDGEIRIQSEDGVLNTSVDRVKSSWQPDGEDPRAARLREQKEALERHWNYEAGIDLLAKEGNSEEFSLGTNFVAKLKSPDDMLKFYGRYEQREKNGDKTEDSVLGGGEYEAFFSDIFGWFVRQELEHDNIEQIELRSTSAGGLSYRLIDEANHNLVARSGLGFRFTSYQTAREDESDPTLDFGLDHMYRQEGLFVLRNSLQYLPSISDFADYRAVQDSSLELPIGTSDFWNLRLGLRNEYDSDPVAPENLDTTYYTEMVLDWGGE